MMGAHVMGHSFEGPASLIISVRETGGGSQPVSMLL